MAGLSLSACSHSPLAYVGHLASQRQPPASAPTPLSELGRGLAVALRAKADKARARPALKRRPVDA